MFAQLLNCLPGIISITRIVHLPHWQGCERHRAKRRAGRVHGAVFDGLAAVGYDGYVTVHQASAQLMSVPEAAKRSAMFLRSLADFVS